MVRLAWHDSATYNASISSWPQCGGANGSIRFDTELVHGGNAGLVKAVGYLKKFKEKFSSVSWADLMQMASVIGIKLCGGPDIPMRWGRIDVVAASQCPKEGNLPDGNAPFGDASADASTHLRRVFYRLGLSNRDIVALSGAHTLGRAFKQRSGTAPEGYGKGTKFTDGKFVARGDGKRGVGMSGGRSWTKKWLTFDNSYFKERDNHLLVLETDATLRSDPEFSPYFNLYAESEEIFFRDYALAHSMLSELGSKFSPPAGFVVNFAQAKL